MTKRYVYDRLCVSWELCIDTGRDPVTGERTRHFESVRGAKRDAQRRLRELLLNVE